LLDLKTLFLSLFVSPPGLCLTLTVSQYPDLAGVAYFSQHKEELKVMTEKPPGTKLSPGCHTSGACCGKTLSAAFLSCHGNLQASVTHLF